jgi:Haem-binding domain
MKNKLKWIFAALVAGFVLLQFTSPPRTNPPVAPGHDLLATNAPPPEIATLLHNACYDCHSDETRWPWYSHIAPVSWLVAGDVAHGRERMNFSDWPRALPERAAKRLERISEEVDDKDMPPAKYTLLHPEARLTAGQREQLIHWADQEAARLKPATTNE